MVKVGGETVHEISLIQWQERVFLPVVVVDPIGNKGKVPESEIDFGGIKSSRGGCRPKKCLFRSG
jgi:hypothetical protein